MSETYQPLPISSLEKLEAGGHQWKMGRIAKCIKYNVMVGCHSFKTQVVIRCILTQCSIQVGLVTFTGSLG